MKPEPEPEWSEAERFVWEKTRAGEEADFNSRENKGIDPKSPDGWDGRRISSEFLETILFEKSFQEAVTRKGVRIIGACFPEKIDLEDGYLPWSLWLEHSRFENGLNMRGLQAEKWVSLEGSVVKGQLNLASASIGGNLVMEAGATFEEVDLRGAQIEGHLVMKSATVTGKLDLDSASIRGALLMAEGATFKEVILRGAQIKSQLAMIGARVTDTLNMDSVSIGDALLMDGAIFKKEVILRGAQIKGQLVMSGTRVTGRLNMDSASIGDALLMAGAIFKKEVILRGAQITGQLSMIDATVKGTLDMASASIGDALLMAKGATFKKVILRGAQIKGQLAMRDATVTGTLDMASASVGGALLMDCATFAEVMLRGAQIGDQISLIGARVKGKLEMDSVSVGSALLMGSATFAEVILRGAQIKGQLAMRDATVTGTLDMTSASVGNSLLMDGSTFTDVDLGFVTIGSMLNLTDGTFKTLDLTRTTVEGELRLVTDNKSVKWWSDDGVNEIQFNLHNTQVGTLVDSPKSWPDKIELEGFTYRQLGGVNMHERPARDFIEWLGRDETFSFQPYQQLTTVLRNADKSSTADRVLFAGKERERQNAKSRREYLWLSVLRYCFGYRISSYILRPILVLGLIVTLIGWSVLWLTDEDRKHEKTATVGEERTVGRIGLGFSLDYLLPVVQLREDHYKVNLTSCFASVYFSYIHQIVGYILVFFVIAALTGITNPSNGRGPPG